MGKGGFAGGKGAVPTEPEQVEVHLFGKRVDVTSFLRKHPGGAKALKIFKDRDATEQFLMYHSPAATKKMQLMAQNAPPAPAESDVFGSVIGKDFEALRLKFFEMGLYKPDYKDEIFKLFITLAPGIYGARLLHAGMPCLGAFLIGFSFYMSGWTAHDYLHHGVLKNGQRQLVLWNNIMGFVLGMWQGFVPGWWRARHNTHHLVTNEKGNDPDIKTAPALTFVRNNAKLAKTLNAVQRWQQYYYVPLMALLDVYWRLEGIQYLTARKLKETWLEWSLMVVHYAVLGFVFSNEQGIMWGWLLFMTLVRGFLTGIVVFATHYGEEHLEGGNHKMTLVEQTALTSRNITGGHVVNVLTGYISLQTEHHLFPMMPTAHLDKAQPLVRAFFKKHGLHYRESNLVECVKFNIAALEPTGN
jgi:fatty acid desaturase